MILCNARFARKYLALNYTQARNDAVVIWHFMMPFGDNFWRLLLKFYKALATETNYGAYYLLFYHCSVKNYISEFMTFLIPL